MPHYYSEKQSTYFNPEKIIIRLKNICFEAYSSKGVFSKKKLDKGSRLLVENAIIKPEAKILDLGCGIGLIGIALKLKYPCIKVEMADINERALKLSRMNAKLNMLDIKVIKSDLYSRIKGSYDSILSNPPMAAGKKTCLEIISKAPRFLKNKGMLQIVAMHNKGGISLKKKMQEVFGNVEEIAKGSGYRVYMSKKMDNNL